MRVVIQRVKSASVEVEGAITAKIQKGLLVLVGFEEEDAQEDFEWMSNKLIQLRIFNDENNIMNLSLKDIKGELLVISQFTLQASTKKGNRPSYIKASKPEIAIQQYETFLDTLSRQYVKEVQSGVFGADMKIELINDGPVTICMDSKNKI